MEFFKNIYNIFSREIMKIIRDKNLLMIFIVAPMTYPLMYGAIYMNKVEQNVPVAIYDEDNSVLSRGLIREIDAHQNIAVTENIYNESEIRNILIYEKAQAVLIIPKSFSEKIKTGKSTNINLIISPGRLLVLSDIGIPISQIASGYGAKINASYLSKKGIPVFENKRLIQPIKIEFKNLFNPYLTYGDLILPALMIIIISQLLVIGVGAASAAEWSLNNWMDLISVSNNYLSILIGKLLAYLTIFIFFSLLILAILSPIYHISLGNNYLALGLIGMMGILASASFGLFIGTFFKHRITAFVILGFTSYPFFMMTGYAWPKGQLPMYIQYISHVFPMVPFVQSILSVSQMNNDISYVAPQFINLVAIIVAYSLLFFIRLYKIKHKKERYTRFGRY
jgi:ABC-2 type transport system permease protein